MVCQHLEWYLGEKKNNAKAYECNDYKKYGTKRCKGHEILEEDMWFQFKDFLKNTKKFI